MDRRRTGTDGDAAGEQVELPLEADGAPIDYVLTARARRLVAPETLPELTVVETPGAVDIPETDRHDARPARARALRRAGVAVEEISAQLGVGGELVSAWCRQVVPTRRRRTDQRERATPPAGARLRARREAADLLVGGSTAAVAGIVAGVAAVTATSVTLILTQTGLVPGIVAWLKEHAGADPATIRLHIEAGDGVSRDLLVRDWSARLELGAGQLTHARWYDAPEVDSVRFTIRSSQAQVAAAVAGWRDAIAAHGTA